MACRVLVVHGSPATRGELARALGEAFEVTTVARGHDALARVIEARGDGEPFAIAFADMPDTADALRRADPDLQVIVGAQPPFDPAPRCRAGAGDRCGA